jgi:O-antigen/teichoic acid export membrane protein
LVTGHVLVGRAAALSAGRATASLLAAAWLVLLARRLTLNDFGDVSVALALVIILGTLSDFGLQIILGRDVVENRRIRRSVLDRVVARRLVLAILASVLLLVLYVVGTRDSRVAVPLIFAASLAGAAMYGPAIHAYRTLGNIRLEIVCEIGSRAVVLVGGGIWIMSGGGIIAAAATYAGVGLAVGLAAYGFVRSRSGAATSAEPAAPSLAARATAPFVLASAVGAVYQRIDNYLVALLRGAAAAGLYSASYRFQDLILILPTALGQVALSDMSGLNPRERFAIARRIVVQGSLVAAMQAVVIAVLAEPLLRLLFGPTFAQAAPTVVALMISTVPGAAAIVLASLAAITDARGFARATAGSLAINVVANLVLIPPFGGVGAGIANIVSQTYLAAALYGLLRKASRAHR